jgi:hypothetical protein
MIRAGVLLALVAGPAAAQPLFSPPAGCFVFATVQGSDCTVEHMMECEGQPGVTSVTIYPDGGDFISTVDTEARWMSSFNGFDGMTETLIEPEADPSLLSDLLVTGRNAYDFTTLRSDGAVTRFVGKEALTGDQIEMNGVVLLRTQNQMEVFAEDGSWLWSVVSQEYVSPDWGVFLGGTAMWNTPADGEYPGDSSPVEILLPGDPGFLGTVPAYGCLE